MFFLCMNGSGQQHYKGYVITSLCFSYKNNKKRITIEHFSHFITMNKTSKFLVLLKPSLRSCLPYVLNARNDILKEDKII